jgi:hypothetical protein
MEVKSKKKEIAEKIDVSELPESYKSNATKEEALLVLQTQYCFFVLFSLSCMLFSFFQIQLYILVVTLKGIRGKLSQAICGFIS